MSKNILVAVAWPYASGSRHLGHIGGAYLPADVFARYHRVIGNNVLMVSGSDAHGTPITVRADEEGVEPIDIVNKYHSEFLDYWENVFCIYIKISFLHCSFFSFFNSAGILPAMNAFGKYPAAKKE